MKWRELLDQWSLSSLKINVGVLDAEFKPSDQDKEAAWTRTSSSSRASPPSRC